MLDKYEQIAGIKGTYCAPLWLGYNDFVYGV